MPTLAVLSMAVAGNMILLLASSPVGVHALNAVPHSVPRTLSMSHSTPFSPLSVPSAGLASSTLFGAKRGRSQQTISSMSSSSVLHSSMPNGSNMVDAEIAESPSTKSSSSSFLRAIDNFGMKLKPWAVRAYEKSLEYSDTSPASNVNATDANSTTSTTSSKGNDKFKSILCRIQANVLWMSYIFYRGYRGFFVILPAVFKEVYRQLEDSGLVLDVYGDDEDEEKEYAVNDNAEQKQQPVRLRTRITISVLSAMLTLSYVVSGGLRVLGKFIKTFTNTTSVESSLEAAAEEVALNEDKLRNKMQ